jgi:hypothetical protein
MSTSPVLPDEVQAIISAAQSLGAKVVAAQQQYAQLQQSDADLAQKFNTDEALIQQMRAAAVPSVAPNLLASLPTGAAITAFTGLHLLPFVADPNARPLLQWFQPGPTGNSNPKPTDPHGTWNAIQQNGITTLTISPAGAFNNYFYAINVVKGDTQATRYAQLVTFEVPDEALPNCQAIETNWEHSLGGFRYNQGTQFLFEGGNAAQVRYYDIAAKGWKPLPSVPFPKLGTGKPVTVINEVQRTSGGMVFVAIAINGTRYPLNITTKAIATNWGSYLQGAVQMDVTGSGKGYTLKLKDAQAAFA